MLSPGCIYAYQLCLLQTLRLCPPSCKLILSIFLLGCLESLDLTDNQFILHPPPLCHLLSIGLILYQAAIAAVLVHTAFQVSHVNTLLIQTYLAMCFLD
jgi:hypothetical protein